MKTFATAEELAEAFRSKLEASALRADEVIGHRDGVGDWSLSVRLRGRQFAFGTVIRDGYYFVEHLGAGKVIDYLSDMPQPMFGSDERLWRLSFDLLRTAIADEGFRGPTQLVI